MRSIMAGPVTTGFVNIVNGLDMNQKEKKMLKYDLVAGIDPGKSGSIAYFKEGTVKAIKMPMDAKDMQSYFQYIKSISTFPLVFIEKLSYMASDRNIPGRDFNIQKMLSHFERLKTTMQLNNLLFIEVPAVTWQTYLHLKIKNINGVKEPKEERKKRYKIAAQSYYPKVKVTLSNCDALLLVEFGRRKLQYDPDWIIERLPEKNNNNEKYLL